METAKVGTVAHGAEDGIVPRYGYGKADDRSGLLSVFWNTVEKIDASMSDSNPADAPSRGDYQEPQARQAHWVEPRIPKEIMKKEYWHTIIDDPFIRPQQRTSSGRSSLWSGEFSPAQDRGCRRSDVHLSSFGQCPTNLIDTMSHTRRPTFNEVRRSLRKAANARTVANVHPDGRVLAMALAPSLGEGA